MWNLFIKHNSEGPRKNQVTILHRHSAEGIAALNEITIMEY